MSSRLVCEVQTVQGTICSTECLRIFVPYNDSRISKQSQPKYDFKQINMHKMSSILSFSNKDRKRVITLIYRKMSMMTTWKWAVYIGVCNGTSLKNPVGLEEAIGYESP